MAKKNSEKSFDVVIVGGGAAGISAALWCDELGLKTLLLEEKSVFGGQLWRVYNPIKNYLGVETKNGRDLQKIFLNQIGRRKFMRQVKSKIISLNLNRKTVVTENKDSIKWRCLILATGVSRRKLAVENEEKFNGAGIIESGKRDIKIVKNKSVAIIGGGDAALENALILAESASKVTVIHRRKNFAARQEFVEKACANERINFLFETVVTKFDGEKKLASLKLQNIKTQKNFALPIDAALLRIGVKPNTEFLRGKIDLDQQGYIKVDENGETNVANVFAIGDVANPFAPTISSAVGMGATAAKVIFDKLKS